MKTYGSVIVIIFCHLSLLYPREEKGHGGYDYDFVSNIPDRYRCCLCRKVLCDPYLTGCCGTHFCHSCFTYYQATQKGKKICPECGEEDFPSLLDKSVIKQVNTLEIYCPNCKDGCEWVGELEKLQNHQTAEEGCGYVAVSCTNQGCEECVKRKDLPSHVQELCEYRPYECEYCHFKDVYRVICGAHCSECLEYPLTCPNCEAGCEWRGKRVELKKHLDSDEGCSYVVVTCTNGGCDINMERRYLHNHVKDECDHRPYRCEYCHHEDIYRAICGTHYLECLKYPLACPNCKDGCEWQGKRGELQHHLISEEGCRYVLVTCTTEKCTQMMKRSDLRNHVKEDCIHRPYQCEYCHHEDTYSNICGAHYDNCTEYPLTCHNNCGVTDRRVVMVDHYSSCPLEPVECPFRSYGCVEMIARKDLHNHIEANEYKHTLFSIKSLQRSNEEIRHDLQKLQLAHEQMKKELTILKVNFNLSRVGAILKFPITDFTLLREENRVWCSPPWSICGLAQVSLRVNPCGEGKGRHTHISISLILEEIETSEDFHMEFDVSVSVLGEQRSGRVMTLCTCRNKKSDGAFHVESKCVDYFPFPSPKEVLKSEELFLKNEEAQTLLVNEVITLQLKLLQHKHVYVAKITK